MEQVLIILLVPLVPVSFLGLILWLDHLEETLDSSVKRRAVAVQRQDDVAHPVTGAQPSFGVSASRPVSPATVEADRAAGGSTKR
ncbi:MAG: hypothetical protein GEU93_15205 [Propionibacteriales bacterium]|nr:hypothetical protein [Propionibacteriales bacterium]